MVKKTVLEHKNLPILKIFVVICKINENYSQNLTTVCLVK